MLSTEKLKEIFLNNGLSNGDYIHNSYIQPLFDVIKTMNGAASSDEKSKVLDFQKLGKDKGENFYKSLKRVIEEQLDGLRFFLMGLNTSSSKNNAEIYNYILRLTRFRSRVVDALKEPTINDLLLKFNKYIDVEIKGEKVKSYKQDIENAKNELIGSLKQLMKDMTPKDSRETADAYNNKIQKLTDHFLENYVSESIKKLKETRLIDPTVWEQVKMPLIIGGVATLITMAFIFTLPIIIAAIPGLMAVGFTSAIAVACSGWVAPVVGGLMVGATTFGGKMLYDHFQARKKMPMGSTQYKKEVMENIVATLVTEITAYTNDKAFSLLGVYEDKNQSSIMFFNKYRNDLNKLLVKRFKKFLNAYNKKFDANVEFDEKNFVLKNNVNTKAKLPDNILLLANCLFYLNNYETKAPHGFMPEYLYKNGLLDGINPKVQDLIVEFYQNPKSSRDEFLYEIGTLTRYMKNSMQDIVGKVSEKIKQNNR